MTDRSEIQKVPAFADMAGPWVRRRWCVWVAVGLVVLGAVLNAVFLWNHCPFEMTGDESHYWMWSQRLDYGYYSKPPGIAWVMFAAQWLGERLGVAGDGGGAALMPVLRMPAVIFGMLSGLLSWGLARRMFRDDRVGLAVILLSAAVPMFAVGSLLITIDSPMYLCWAGTVYCLWRAVEAAEHAKRKTQSAKLLARTGWLYAAGVCAAVGMMFKPVLIALPLMVALGAWRDRGMRRAFKTWHSLGALVVMLLSFVPVVLWNATHGWVMFRHIMTQGGLGRQAGEVKVTLVQKLLLDPLARLGSYAGGQAGGMGGLVFLLLVLAVIFAWRQLRATRGAAGSARAAGATGIGLDDAAAEEHTRWTFLLSFFLPLWGFYFALNLVKGTEVNWPAAGYFTGMILLAAVVVRQWHSAVPKVRRDWRGWTTATVIWGVLLTAVVTNLYRLYPIFAEKLKPLAGTAAYDKSWWNPRKWDPAATKLMGMRERADVIDAVWQRMQKPGTPAPLLIADRYDTASSLTFYMPGHPFVYCLMSSLGGRQNQYDLWPGLDERSADGTYKFAGRDALLIDVPLQDPDVRAMMEKAFVDIDVKNPTLLPIVVGGVTLKYVVVYQAHGFHAPPGGKGGIF